MDKRLQEIYDNLDDMTLGIDDTFSFKCRGCGKCCRQREDILLSPKDLYRLAVYLELTVADVLKQYCEVYQGSDSLMPIARLISIGGNNRCPFLDGRKCRVHTFKPGVCAMYPLGRYIRKEPADDGAPIEIRYINNKPDCDHKEQKQTVRLWLARWGISHPDPFFLRWQEVIGSISQFFHMLRDRQATDKIRYMLLNVVFESIYVNYDTSLPFEGQFEGNCVKLRDMLDEFTEIADEMLPPAKENESDGEQK